MRRRFRGFYLFSILSRVIARKIVPKRRVLVSEDRVSPQFFTKKGETKRGIHTEYTVGSAVPEALIVNFYRDRTRGMDDNVTSVKVYSRAETKEVACQGSVTRLNVFKTVFTLKNTCYQAEKCTTMH